MSKSISYYDWQLNFKKRTYAKTEAPCKQVKNTTLGIPESEFKTFLDTWKKKNL